MHTGLVGRSRGSTALTRTTVQAEVNTTVVSTTANRLVMDSTSDLLSPPGGHLAARWLWGAVPIRRLYDPSIGLNTVSLEGLAA